MKLWQQISMLSLSCLAATTSLAGVVVDRSESGSVKVQVDGNETNTVQSERASKLSLSSTRSKIDSSEKIEVEVDGVKTSSSSGARTKKDKVSLNAVGNNPVQVAVGSSDTATTETSTVDVNALGGAKVDVALDSDTTPTSQVNYVEVNAIGDYDDDDDTYNIEVENVRRGGEDFDSFDDFTEFLTPVVAIRVGMDDANIGNDQEVSIYPQGPDRFKYDEDSDTAFVGGVFAGAELPISENGRCRWQTGVAYYQTSEFNVSGVDYALGNSAEPARKFQYDVSNLRVMWENKFLVGLTDRFSGYLLGAIGWSRNKASDYKSSIIDDTTRSNITFDDNTTNSFSYSFGLGVEMAVMEQVRLGVGYQYTDIGKVRLGNPTDTGSTDTLEKSNVPNNELIFGLSYLFK